MQSLQVLIQGQGMEVENPQIPYWRLSYLEFLIKPQLLIDYLATLLSNTESYTDSKHTITLLFDSLTMTLAQCIDKLPLLQKSRPFEQILAKSPKIRRLFFLLVIIFKQTSSARDIWVELTKCLRESIIVERLQEELKQVITEGREDITLLFSYYRVSEELNKLKKTPSLLPQFKTEWINQELAISLSQNINAHIKLKFLELIRDVMIITRGELPSFFTAFPGLSQLSPKPNPQSQLNQLLGTKNRNQAEDAMVEVVEYKLPSFLRKTDAETKIHYLKSKIFNLPQLVLQSLGKYKSYIKQILQEHLNTLSSAQKSTLYCFLLIIKIIQYTHYFQGDACPLILGDIQATFNEIKDNFQIPIKSCIQILSSLSYLQNLISTQHYPLFHKLITFIMSIYDKEKEKKQYHTLVIFVTFFSFKLSDNNNPLNFTKLWKIILQGDHHEFVHSICSIYFIDSIISFNSLVLAKTNRVNNEYLSAFKLQDILTEHLNNVKNVEIESNESFTIKQIISLMIRKRNLISKLTPANAERGICQESSLQIAKYCVLNRQIQEYFEEFLRVCSSNYLSKVSSSTPCNVDPMFFRLLSSILLSRGLYIPSLISVELQEETLNIKRFVQFQQMVERAREVVQTVYLRYCSPHLLKILLKYCKKTMQDTPAKQIIRFIREPNNYQYFTSAKKARIRAERQYQFLQWVHSLSLHK